MSIKLSFKNISGYIDSEVSVLFHSPSVPLKATNLHTKEIIAEHRWYTVGDLISGVSLTSISGRIYFCYGETFTFVGPQPQTPTAQSFFDRYDKVEITFTGQPSDVADLTSIDFWSIPFQLTSKKNGKQIDVVKGLYDSITAVDAYEKLLSLSTPPVSGLSGAIPALVPGEFKQEGNGPMPKAVFGRIIGPSVYPPTPGKPVFPYNTMEPYLSWLNKTFGPGTGTTTVPGLGNGVIAKINGRFNGVGPDVPSSGPKSRQDYDLSANIDKSLDITLKGTVGNGKEKITLAITKADLLNPTGIYGANPPVSLNGGSAATLGNNVYSWAIGDFLSGLNIGAVGSQEKYNGVAIGSMDSHKWFFGKLPKKYMFSGAQSDRNRYNQYAATLHDISDAYGFPYAERFTDVFAGLNPSNVDELEIKLLEGVLPPEFLVQSKKAWQSTGITVNAGDTISYQAGEWTANPGDNNGNLYDADGNPSFINTLPGYAMPGQNMGMLVGRVGEITFAIGNSGSVPASVSGILELCINDDLDGRYGDGLTDNSGSVRVLIEKSLRI